jgi:hypothetical protein
MKKLQQFLFFYFFKKEVRIAILVQCLVSLELTLWKRKIFDSRSVGFFYFSFSKAPILNFSWNKKPYPDMAIFFTINLNKIINGVVKKDPQNRNKYEEKI